MMTRILTLLSARVLTRVLLDIAEPPILDTDWTVPIVCAIALVLIAAAVIVIVVVSKKHRK